VKSCGDKEAEWSQALEALKSQSLELKDTLEREVKISKDKEASSVRELEAVKARNLELEEYVNAQSRWIETHNANESSLSKRIQELLDEKSFLTEQLNGVQESLVRTDQDSHNEQAFNAASQSAPPVWNSSSQPGYLNTGFAAHSSPPVSGLQSPRSSQSQSSSTSQSPSSPAVSGPRILLMQGDISRMSGVDAIVNAANESLHPGGGVCGAIQGAAGPQLALACQQLLRSNGVTMLEPGDAILTEGFNLPAKYVIHAVGPRGEHPQVLDRTYESCLDVCQTFSLKSVAFCSISTDIFGYPARNAAEVAFNATSNWLLCSPRSLETIVFCVFNDDDLKTYSELIPVFFPRALLY